MARLSAVTAVMALALVAGCGPSLKHVTPQSPVVGLTVQVREFDLPTPLRGVVLPQMEPSVAQRVVQALQKAGVNATLATPPTTSAGLMLEGQVTQIDRGNRGLRYLGDEEGPGAARFGVKGQAVRADGTVVGEFSARRRAGWGLFGGNSDSLLSNCADSVAYDIAEMVISGAYVAHPEDTAFQGNTLFHP